MLINRTTLTSKPLTVTITTTRINKCIYIDFSSKWVTFMKDAMPHIRFSNCDSEAPKSFQVSSQRYEDGC